MKDTETCPYCTNLIEGKTGDHIFSAFLGGTRKIPSCADCNNDIFGSDFEGRAAENLHKWQIMISIWGIELKTDIPMWKNVRTDKGNLHIEVADEIQATHARPIIEKSEDGKFKSGAFRSREEAERHSKNLIKKGISSDTIEIEEDLGTLQEYKFEPGELTLEINNNLLRLVLKMSSALCTLLPEFDLSEIEIARMFLTGANREGGVGYIRPSFNTYKEINSRRPPLAHVIYVERTKAGVLGLVQFFGVFQFICKLGMPKDGKKDQAIMVFLDPVEGRESFDESSIETDPIPLRNLPSALSKEETEYNVKQWIQTLKDEVQRRRANS